MENKIIRKKIQKAQKLTELHKLGRGTPLTVAEAAKATGYSTQTLYNYIHTGSVPHVRRYGRPWLFLKELENFFN